MLEQWKACLVSHRLYKSMVVCSFRIVHYRKVSALRTNQTELKFSKRFFHVVAANHSFSSSNEDSEKFKRLIPRLQRDTHSMLINFGILLYTELLLMQKNLLMNNVNKTFFQTKPQHRWSEINVFFSFFFYMKKFTLH